MTPGAMMPCPQRAFETCISRRKGNLNKQKLQIPSVADLPLWTLALFPIPIRARAQDLEPGVL
ncbi:MAG: hypothetical protein DME25_00330 [Verrucomicrobia bacterium]|nr:MAG: hypothetical protein DME25_00330 [Verrucomicrobiota bacterium]